MTDSCRAVSSSSLENSAGLPEESGKESFANLMQELCAGSEDAARTIAEQFAPHIFRVVRRTLPKSIRSKVDSVDMVNTLLGSLLIKRHLLTSIRDSKQLVALLTKAARNRVIDEHRKYTTSASRDIKREEGGFCDLELEAPNVSDRTAGDGRFGGRESSPSQVAIARERWDLLMASLSKRDRQIISLRMKGFTYEQIADRLEDASARTARRVVIHTMEQLMG